MSGEPGPDYRSRCSLDAGPADYGIMWFENVIQSIVFRKFSWCTLRKTFFPRSSGALTGRGVFAPNELAHPRSKNLNTCTANDIMWLFTSVPRCSALSTFQKLIISHTWFTNPICAFAIMRYGAGNQADIMSGRPFTRKLIRFNILSWCFTASGNHHFNNTMFTIIEVHDQHSWVLKRKSTLEMNMMGTESQINCHTKFQIRISSIYHVSMSLVPHQNYSLIYNLYLIELQI